MCRIFITSLSLLIVTVIPTENRDVILLQSINRNHHQSLKMTLWWSYYSSPNVYERAFSHLFGFVYCNTITSSLNKIHNIVIFIMYLLHYLFIIKFLKLINSAANKGRSTVNYQQSSAFERPYLSCNDHCDQWLFQAIFFLLILFLFLKNHFERSFFWNLNTFAEHKEKFCFPSVCSFFNCCSIIILCVNALHLSQLFQCVNTQD